MSWGAEGTGGKAAMDATGSVRAAGGADALGGSMMVAARVLTTEPSGVGS